MGAAAAAAGPVPPPSSLARPPPLTPADFPPLPTPHREANLISWRVLSEEDSRTGTDEVTEHLRFGVPPPPRLPLHTPSIWFPDPTPPEPSSSWHLHAFVDEGRTHYFYYVCVTTTFVLQLLICFTEFAFYSRDSADYLRASSLGSGGYERLS